MLILENPSQLKPLNLPHIICAVGVFDGIHLGHQKIISIIVQTAKECGGTSVVVTFDKHPFSVLNPAIHLPLLTSPEHKLVLLDSLGVDVCVMMKFTKEVSSITAETWINEVLWMEMHIKAIYLSEDSFFGKDAKGDINLLMHWGNKLGFKIVKLEKVRIENVPVSSTFIRNLIIKGDLVSAQKFLGRQYSVFGTPIKGMGRGEKIGFPTINLNTLDQCLPPNGVYAVWVNKDIPAVANIGVRPTFGNKQIKPILEVHQLSTKPAPLTKNIEVIFKEKIRDEIKFNSVKELADQIGKDIEKTKKIFFAL